jgi:hypothetical protein
VTSPTAAAALVAALGLALGGCDTGPPPIPDEPYLSEAIPAAGPPGTRVELRGANLGNDPGVARVLLAGVAADIDPMLWTDGFVTFTVPELDPGTWALVAEIDGVVSNPLFFTVEPPP